MKNSANKTCFHFFLSDDCFDQCYSHWQTCHWLSSGGEGWFESTQGREVRQDGFFHLSSFLVAIVHLDYCRRVCWTISYPLCQQLHLPLNDLPDLSLPPTASRHKVAMLPCGSSLSITLTAVNNQVFHTKAFSNFFNLGIRAQHLPTQFTSLLWDLVGSAFFFRTLLKLFVFQPPAFAPPMLHFSSPTFPLYESTSNSLLLTTARCLNTGWQTTSKQDGAKKTWAPLGPLFNKSRLSTAALPTLTMPWWQPETVRPTLAPSEGFPQQPGGKPQCYIVITLHSAKSDHDLKSVFCVWKHWQIYSLSDTKWGLLPKAVPGNLL